VISDYDFPGTDVDSSGEDLQVLSLSLQGSEYFKDLQGGLSPSVSATTTAEGPGLQQLSLYSKDSPVIGSAVRLFQTTPECTQGCRKPAGTLVVTRISLVPGSAQPRGAPDTCTREEDPVAGLSLTIHLDQLLASVKPAGPATHRGSGEIAGAGNITACRANMVDLDTDLDGFPILVRSMSTSRRHSWVVPVSPINVGRRWDRWISDY